VSHFFGMWLSSTNRSHGDSELLAARATLPHALANISLAILFSVAVGRIGQLHHTSGSLLGQASIALQGRPLRCLRRGSFVLCH
jgi:hypothetical protein